MNSPSGPPRRRNGRQQACEPCRRRKVACDHGLPICSRCRRGAQPKQCVYLVHGQPLDVGGSSSAAASAAASNSGGHDHHSGAGAATVASSSTSTSGADTTTTTPQVSGHNKHVGYLGATSFSAVLGEAQSSLASVGVLGQEVHERCESETPEAAAAAEAVRPLVPFGNEKCEMGIRILRSIPSRASSYYLLKIHTNPNDGWVRLAAHRLLDSLWATFGAHLEASSESDRHLGEVSRRLSQNSARPLPEAEDGAAWVRAFSGENLRWEALGVLFGYWTLGAISLTENDATVECRRCFWSDRRKLWQGYKENVWRCIELTRDAPGSSMGAFLHYMNTLLETLRSGDAGMGTWRFLGETVAFSTFLGLHMVMYTSPGTYTIETEVRRRTFAIIFMFDKVIATFTGRPPLLPRRYISSQLPLDISDEKLLDEPPDQWYANVDEHGWNTEGKVYATTIVRARMSLAVIRDEILELALDTSQRADYQTCIRLKAKAMEAISQFPACIIFSPNDVKDTFIAAPILYSKLVVRVEHLGNIFIIQRMMNKDHPELNTELLDIAFEMVSLTLVFWTHKDRLAGLQGDIEWLVMSCAVPASGVLCTELLRPSRPHRESIGGGGGSSTPGGRAVPATRSRVIQQLSLLVGFLDWVGPTAPNGDLCMSAKNVIRHVLDVALNPAADASGLLGGANEWDVDFSVDLNDFFNFELLDTFDWLKA